MARKSLTSQLLAPPPFQEIPTLQHLPSFNLSMAEATVNIFSFTSDFPLLHIVEVVNMKRYNFNKVGTKTRPRLSSR